MVEAKKLISLRVSERDWADFMRWADKRGSNASVEINRYIRETLGRIDSKAENVDTTKQITSVENLVKREDFEAAIAALRGEVISKDEIESLKVEFENLRGEVENLKKDEPIE